MIQLLNNKIKALIDPFGAELKSLKLENKEYLWQGDAASWNGQSPQLFPIIGSALKDGWDYKGKTVSMGNHGFARKSLFSIEEQSKDSCRLRLSNTEESLKEYPFSFFLDIEYKLSESGLEVSYHVENRDADDMLFSLGAHPGFNCPLTEGTSFEDYYIEFEKKESINRRWKETYLTGESEPVLNDNNRIDLNYALFDKGAIIMSGLKSDSVTLKSEKSTASVHMNFAGFPDFGIWTIAGKSGPYICLEPWFGVDSTEGDSRDFEKKEGLVRLQGKDDFSCFYNLTLT